MEPPNPQKEKFEELAPAAIAPPVANRPIVPSSGVVPVPPAQLPVSMFDGRQLEVPNDDKQNSRSNDN
jgi:hypothetical protein